MNTCIHLHWTLFLVFWIHNVCCVHAGGKAVRKHRFVVRATNIWMHETPFKIWLYYGRLPQYIQLMGVHGGYARSIENQFSFMIRAFFSLALYLSSPFHPPSLFFLLPFSVHVFPVHLQAQPLVRNMQINLLISCIESLRLSWNTCLATIPAY